MSRAKRLVAGRMMLRMEDTRAVSEWMGSQLLVRRHIMRVDDVVERIDAVTTEDLTPRRVGTASDRPAKPRLSRPHAEAKRRCRDC